MGRKQTGASSFDEIAVGLSSGTLSRGKALRLMGAALVGGLLASLPGIAQAAPPLCSRRRPCPGDCGCISLAKGERACQDAFAILPLVSSCGECANYPGTVCVALRGGRQLACLTPCSTPPG
jgi:hypothetical protein